MKVFQEKNCHILFVLILIGMVALLSHDTWKSYDYRAPYQFGTMNDINTYYSYLPALFVEGDLTFQFENVNGYWLGDGIDGKKVPKFSMGLAILYCPFFLIGHMVALNSDVAADGHTLPYSTALMAGTLFYFFIGFFLLLKCLSHYFDKSVVIIAGLSIFFGTNLFYYTFGEGEMSHSYLFVIFSAILYFTHGLWESGKSRNLLWIGLLLGLTMLIRPTDVVFGLIPVFWGVSNKVTLINRLTYFASHYKLVVLSLFVFMIPITPQLIFWKINAGSFFFFSYQGERFFFGSPKIYDFLLGYRKGWFIYTPLMFFAVAGLFLLWKYVRQMMWVLPLVIIITIYLSSSWWCWWYGGSFGMRPMVEYYAALIFPLSALIDFILRRKYLPLLFTPVLFFLIYLNIHSTYKYRIQLIHFDGMNKKAFWSTFLKTKFTPHDFEVYNSNIRSPNAEKCRQNIDR